MDPRDNSRVANRRPWSANCSTAAARYHGGDADDVREALVVRHALQPFAPAAFGARARRRAAAGRRRVEPRRFSFDARWRPAAGEAAGADAAPVFAPAALRLPRRDVDDDGAVVARIACAAR